MRQALLLSLLGLSHAYLVGRPLDWVPPARSPARSAHPTLVLSDIKGAAIEATVSHKVQRKLADAQAKYDIPQKYIDVIHGFFTNYMVEIYKSGGDMVILLIIIANAVFFSYLALPSILVTATAGVCSLTFAYAKAVA